MEPSQNEEEKNKELDNEDKGWQNRGLMNYSDKEKQSVFTLFGIEMTAPASLKNPGLIYISFLVINLFLFIVLRKLVITN